MGVGRLGLALAAHATARGSGRRSPHPPRCAC
jgi:hypothetical protein